VTVTLLAPPIAIEVVDLGDRVRCAAIDQFVRTHRDATPFHLTGWSRAVATGCRQRSHYLAASTADGAIAGLLPLTEIRSPLFGNALVSSGFAVDGGALAHHPDTATALIDHGWAHAQSRGLDTFEMRGGPVPDHAWHIDEETYLGFVRPIAADDEAELKAIPRKQRAEVRKALAGDLSVDIGRDVRHLAEHYRVYAQSVHNLGTPVFPRTLFAQVLAELGDHADILIVRHGGEPVAAVLSLYLNNVVYPYWGGGTFSARGLRANDLMYFALMRHARGRGCTRFDFGRSKAGTGPAAFKKNWGFDPHPLAYAKRSRDGAVPREINPLSPRYRLQVAGWKKLPLWLANRLGPPIARGLG
jgi:FemAB-related protein (PEP-CTERM system-associated)